jgi:predicted RNA-binding Zn-ribbon protein involved in translation (DUF1610 family)
MKTVAKKSPFKNGSCLKKRRFMQTPLMQSMEYYVHTPHSCIAVFTYSDGAVLFRCVRCGNTHVTAKEDLLAPYTANKKELARRANPNPTPPAHRKLILKIGSRPNGSA